MVLAAGIRNSVGNGPFEPSTPDHLQAYVAALLATSSCMHAVER